MSASTQVQLPPNLPSNFPQYVPPIQNSLQNIRPILHGPRYVRPVMRPVMAQPLPTRKPVGTILPRKKEQFRLLPDHLESAVQIRECYWTADCIKWQRKIELEKARETS